MAIVFRHVRYMVMYMDNFQKGISFKDDSRANLMNRRIQDDDLRKKTTTIAQKGSDLEQR